MSRNLLNLGLFVFVVLLMAIVIWEPGQQTVTTSKLSALQSAQINRIHIQRDALQDIELEKQNDHWQMLKPYPVAADETRVNNLLKLVDAASYTQFSREGRDIANYGLEPVLAQVTLNDSRFQFGSLEHISKRRYVLSDNTIHLVTDIFYHQLRTSATQFVSPRLISDRHAISRLNLAHHQYERKHDGSWLVIPAIEALSADRLNAFIDNWQRLTASRISKASKEQVSQEQVSVEFTDASKLVFDILRNDNEVLFVRRDLGLQYHVAKQAAEALFNPPGAEPLQQY